MLSALINAVCKSGSARWWRSRIQSGRYMLWTLNHPSVYSLFLEERGWSPEEYERWLAVITCEQLLG